jgi:hypothetical protein
MIDFSVPLVMTDTTINMEWNASDRLPPVWHWQPCERYISRSQQNKNTVFIKKLNMIQWTKPQNYTQQVCITGAGKLDPGLQNSTSYPHLTKTSKLLYTGRVCDQLVRYRDSTLFLKNLRLSYDKLNGCLLIIILFPNIALHGCNLLWTPILPTILILKCVLLRPITCVGPRPIDNSCFTTIHARLE